MEGISIPVRICDIGKFEKNNPDISITLFGLTETHDLFPVHVAETQKEHHIQLLYLSNTRTSHYVLVKSLSALVYHQISRHDEQKYFCENCLNPFSTEDVRDKHALHCKLFDPV